MQIIFHIHLSYLNGEVSNITFVECVFVNV